MLIGRLVMFYPSIFRYLWFRVNSRLGVGSLIDGSQNALWPLALEDDIPQNYENRSNSISLQVKCPKCNGTVNLGYRTYVTLWVKLNVTLAGRTPSRSVLFFFSFFIGRGDVKIEAH